MDIRNSFRPVRCMGVLLACICGICTVCVPSATGGQKKVPETWGLEGNGCEFLSGCWELNRGPLEEQQCS